MRDSEMLRLLPVDARERLLVLSADQDTVADWEYRVNGREISCSITVLQDLQVGHVHLKDITDRKIAEQRIHFLAYYDNLTTLPNRRSFDGDISAAIAACGEGQQLVIGQLALDRSQLVSASNGFEVADDLVAAVAQRLSRFVDGLSSQALLYRFSRSNLALLLTAGDAEHLVWDVAKSLAELFEEPFEVRGLYFYLSLSQGYSIYPLHGEQGSELLKNADAALNRVMEDQGDKALLYSADMAFKEQAWISLEVGLRRAVEQQELSLYFQPQVAIANGKLVGMEALLCWQRSDGSFVSPAEFIPVAEQTGMIISLGEWVLRSACLQANSWFAEEMRDFVIAVNISARQFRHHNFLAMVAEVLAETGIDPSFVELEITESMIMHNADSCIDVLNELKQMGLALTIDDFGTGYSSLSYLKKFPIDKLKIDQSFVQNLAVDRDNLLIIRTVIDLAHNLNLSVIAEGVETEEQRQLLADHGCEEIQGYLISRPLPSQEAFEFFDSAQYP